MTEPSRQYPPSSLPQPLPSNRTPSSFLSTRTASGLTSLTPSMLTPNTRSEAEAALSANSAIQTDAAAPTTPPVPKPAFDPTAAAAKSATGEEQQQHLPDGDQGGRRQSLGMRPPVPTRSSSNYLNALGASGTLTSAADPAQGVVEAHAADAAAAKGEGATAGEAMLAEGFGGEATAAEEAPAGAWRPRADRKQSWSQQDMRRVMQERLMGKAEEGDMGYDSATEESRAT